MMNVTKILGAVLVLVALALPSSATQQRMAPNALGPVSVSMAGHSWFIPALPQVVGEIPGGGSWTATGGSEPQQTTPDKYVATWQSSGIEIKVEVPKKQNESATNHAARFKAAVDACLEQFPKDPPSGG